MGKYEIISGDGHVEVPADMWHDYVPEKYRDLAPRLVTKEDGTEFWRMGSSGTDPFVVPANGSLNLAPSSAVDAQKATAWERENFGNLVCDLPYDEIKPGVWKYYYPDGSSRPGTGTAAQRLSEQDIDGVDAEVLFPPVYGPKFLRLMEPSNPQGYLALVRGYNTWLGEEYCATAPDRLIGNAITPETGVEDAIAEMRRCKELGLRATCLGMWPNGGPTFKPEDDRFWAASLDLDMRVTGHASFGEGQAADPRSWAFTPGGQTPAANSFTQLIVSGALDRYPSLRIYFAETQAGWIPHTLNMLDEWYAWWYSYVDAPLPRMPSEYFRSNAIFNFIDDRLAMQFRYYIGLDLLTWGSDFPHSVGTYPSSSEILEDLFEGVPEEERRQVLVGNVCDFFGLDANRELTPTPVPQPTR